MVAAVVIAVLCAVIVVALLVGAVKALAALLPYLLLATIGVVMLVWIGSKLSSDEDEPKDESP